MWCQLSTEAVWPAPIIPPNESRSTRKLSGWPNIKTLTMATISQPNLTAQIGTTLCLTLMGNRMRNKTTTTKAPSLGATRISFVDNQIRILILNFNLSI